MITANDIYKTYFEAMDYCAADTRASETELAKLALIGSGMRIMAQAVIDLINVDEAVDAYVEGMKHE